MTRFRLWMAGGILALALAGCNMNQPASQTAGTAPSTTTAAAPALPPLTATAQARIAAYDDAIRISTDPRTKGRAYLDKAAVYLGAGRRADAIDVYSALVRDLEKDATVEAKRFVAVGLLNRGTAQKEMKQADAAIASFEEVARRFGSESDMAILRHLAHGAFSIGDIRLAQGKPEATLAGYGPAIERFCAVRDDLVEVSCAAMRRVSGAAQERLRNHAAALAAYNQVAQAHGASTAIRTRKEVSHAYLRKAFLLGNELKQRPEAAEAYEQAVRYCTPTSDFQSKVIVATALINRASIFAEQGKRAEAIAIYDDIYNRFKDGPEASLQSFVGAALQNKAGQYFNMKRYAEAVPLYQEAQKRLARVTDSFAQRNLAQSFQARGQALLLLNRPDEAIAEFDQVMNRFSNSNDSTLRESAAQAALAKANAVRLKQLRIEIRDFLGEFDTKLRTAESEAEPKRSETVADILVAKGVVLIAFGFHSEAIEATEDLIRRLGDANSGKLRERLASARYLKGLALNLLGQKSEAGLAMREVVNRHRDDSAPAIQRTVRQAEEWLTQNTQYDPIG